MRLLLACNLGMSTSLLVEKLKAEAKSRGLELEVDAVPFDKVILTADKTDILLLGPQIRYLVKKFEAQMGDKIPVIAAMNMSDYGLLNAKKILDESLTLYHEKMG